ncbi:protein SENSITIVITY TO RED LIGHT REDUCED 1-like [Actinidia eriantha]|uniref:protein SENSITIVITY TO RED LIGHT REDUCED 1-like n=1 Tax=Actinidia eriantha TaxID=165200 RepID=UPI002589B2D9|nr:protein SENSITIVITY TO RED LIGHT REDUCED 1-like [Actinidia eriantha]
MVIYGLGSIEYTNVSQYQLALAILLKSNFSHWIGGVEVFTLAILLGCSVLTVNEHCKRQVEKPTLFYLPYLDKDLMGNLLEANWWPERLNKMVVLANSFEALSEQCKKTSTMTMSNGKFYSLLREILEYIKAIHMHTT